MLIRNAGLWILKDEGRGLGKAPEHPIYDSDGENNIKHEKLKHHNSVKLEIQIWQSQTVPNSHIDLGITATPCPAHFFNQHCKQKEKRKQPPILLLEKILSKFKVPSTIPDKMLNTARNDCSSVITVPSAHSHESSSIHSTNMNCETLYSGIPKCSVKSNSVEIELWHQ